MVVKKRGKISFGASPAPGIRLPVGQGYQIYHQPSPRARRLWCYLRLIGKANAPSTFHHEHRGHDGFLLHFVLRGNLRHRLNERTYVLKPGEAILMDLREDVSYDAAGRSKVSFFWAQFDGRDMPLLFAELRADREPVFSNLDRTRVRSLFESLVTLAERQPPAADAKMGSELLGLIGELLASRSYPISFVAQDGAVQPLSFPVRKAIDSLVAFYDEPGIRMKQVANVVGQSLPYFMRRFHREVGISPKAYLNRYRIERAKSELEGSDRTMEEIARSVGFRDPAYFARQFVKLTRLSPRAYRRIHQKRR